MNRWTALAIAILIALLSGGSVALIIDSGGVRVETRTVASDPTPTPADELPVSKEGEETHAKPGEAGAPAPSESYDIPGMSESGEKKVADDTREAIEEGTYDTSGVLKGATAQPARKKCYTSQNGGPRSLSQIGLGIVHVTVSRNVIGLPDIDGLCGFFRRVKASPTWTVDNEANSAENVPLERVPWTQAWYNRPSCSIEFVGSTGRPGEGPAQWTDVQLREGARLMAQCFKKAGIPVRQGIVSDGGRVVLTGIRTHQQLGKLGGGHSDPGPYFNMARFEALMRQFAQSATVQFTKAQRVACRKLTWWRKTREPGRARRNAVLRRVTLAHRKLKCAKGQLAPA